MNVERGTQNFGRLRIPARVGAIVCLFTFAVCLSASAGEPAKRLLLLSQKPDGHPPGTHEYAAGQRILAHLLKSTPGLELETIAADGAWPEGPELLARADGVVLFVSEGARWVREDPRRYEAFARLAQRGGALSAYHWGTGTKDARNIEPFVRLFGASHGGPDRKFRVVDVRLTPAASEHPILAGVAPVDVHEEFYFALKRDRSAGAKLAPLATVRIDDREEMVGWALERADGGRSFGFTGLHFHDNWRLPEVRRLMAQGVLWTLKLPIPADGVDVSVSDELLRWNADSRR